MSDLPTSVLIAHASGRLVRWALVPTQRFGDGTVLRPYYRPVGEDGQELAPGEVAELGFGPWTSRTVRDALADSVPQAPARTVVAAADRPARRPARTAAEALHVALGAAGYRAGDHYRFAERALGLDRGTVRSFAALSPVDLARVRLALLVSRRAATRRAATPA